MVSLQYFLALYIRFLRWGGGGGREGIPKGSGPTRLHIRYCTNTLLAYRWGVTVPKRQRACVTYTSGTHDEKAVICTTQLYDIVEAPCYVGDNWEFIMSIFVVESIITDCRMLRP